tara:strand:- start:15037 stop:15387 length:351 start_codon:yes stop_codon:yes gene_type:complete
MKYYIAIVFALSGAVHAGSQASERPSANHDQYLQASLKRYAQDRETSDAILKADKLWKTYRDAQCDAVYSSWREGSIRFSAHENCVTSMNKARSKELWQSFLTYVDSTPPILPEPR